MSSNPIPLVLVVEPDPVQRDLMQLCLKRIGCEILTTTDPDQILTLITKKHPSLLVLDTFLPGSSGLEVLKDLNSHNLTRKMLVFIISSFGFPEIIQQAKDAGAVEFMIKPLDIEVFSERVMKLLKI